MENKIVIKGEMKGSKLKFRVEDVKSEKDFLCRIVRKIRKIKKSSK